MTTQIWGFLGTTDVELTPGVLDGNAREAFTRGQCHALALSIAELTGWTVGGVGWACADCGGDPEWCDCETEGQVPHHVVVQLDNGDLLDVNGFGVENKWGGDFAPVTPEWIQEHLIDAGQYMEPDLEAGRAFAPVVLKEYA